MTTNDTVQTDLERCTERTVETVQGIIKGDITKVKSLRPQVRENATIVIREQISKDQQARKTLEDITRVCVEEFQKELWGIDSCLDTDYARWRENLNINYRYVGSEKPAIVSVLTGIKSGGSILSKQLILAVYAKAINDRQRLTLIINHPAAPYVDFEGLYTRRSIDDVLAFMHAHKEGLQMREDTLERLAEREFDEVFNTLRLVYNDTYEHLNVRACRELAHKFSAENEKVEEHRRWTVQRVAAAHFVYSRYALSMIQQLYYHPVKSKRIIGEIQKYEIVDGANDYFCALRDKVRGLGLRKLRKRHKNIPKRLKDTYKHGFYYKDKKGCGHVVARRHDLVVDLKSIEKDVDREIFTSDARDFVREILNRYEARKKEVGISRAISTDRRVPGQKGLTAISYKLSQFEKPPGFLVLPHIISETQISEMRETRGLHHDTSSELDPYVKDYNLEPKPNGFSAIIQRIELPNGVGETQMRTPMQQWHEQFVSAHEREYKDKIDQILENDARTIFKTEQEIFGGHISEHWQQRLFRHYKPMCIQEIKTVTLETLTEMLEFKSHDVKDIALHVQSVVDIYQNALSANKAVRTLSFDGSVTYTDKIGQLPIKLLHEYKSKPNTGLRIAREAADMLTKEGFIVDKEQINQDYKILHYNWLVGRLNRLLKKPQDYPQSAAAVLYYCLQQKRGTLGADNEGFVPLPEEAFRQNKGIGFPKKFSAEKFVRVLSTNAQKVYDVLTEHTDANTAEEARPMLEHMYYKAKNEVEMSIGAQALNTDF
jgi:hypothetical protein